MVRMKEISKGKFKRIMRAFCKRGFTPVHWRVLEPTVRQKVYIDVQVGYFLYRAERIRKKERFLRIDTRKLS